MVDFRYHLVSLISVFVALAIGIVLGAGAVGDSFSAGLAGQVEQLRSEKDELRALADDNRAQVDQLSGYVVATSPGVVSGSMPGRTITVISDSDATRASVDSTGGLLEAADAKVGMRIQLRSALWSEEGSDARTAATEALRSQGIEVDGDGGPADLALLVGDALTGNDSSLTWEHRTAIWDVFEAEGLASIDGDRNSTPDALLYLTANSSELRAAQDGELSDGMAATVDAQLGMIHGARNQAKTIVLASETETGTAEGTSTILATVRANPALETISTTDRLDAPDGPVLAVLALVESLDGRHGHYGTGADADARVPALPSSDGQASPVPVPEVSDGGQG